MTYGLSLVSTVYIYIYNLGNYRSSIFLPNVCIWTCSPLERRKVLDFLRDWQRIHVSFYKCMCIYRHVYICASSINEGEVEGTPRVWFNLNIKIFVPCERWDARAASISSRMLYIRAQKSSYNSASYSATLNNISYRRNLINFSFFSSFKTLREFSYRNLFRL